MSRRPMHIQVSAESLAAAWETLSRMLERESAAEQPWRPIIDGLQAQLVEVMAEDPQLTPRLGPLLQRLLELRSVIEERFHDERRELTSVCRCMVQGELPRRGGRRMAVIMRSGPMASVPSPDASALPDDAGSGGLPDKRYAIRGDSLREHALPEDRITVQINRRDYNRVAKAFEMAIENAAESDGLTSAREIRHFTSDAQRHLGLSLTHVYLCLRFWQHHGLIIRHRGGRFGCGDPSSDRFGKLAGRLWQAVKEAES